MGRLFPLHHARRDNGAELRRLTPFRECTNAELRLIDRFMTRIDLPADRVLLQEGERGQEAIFIVDGLVRVERDGQELALLGPGDVIGEMAILESVRRNATVTSVTPVRVFVLDVREFIAVLDTVPGVRRWVEDVAAARRQANAA